MSSIVSGNLMLLFPVIWPAVGGLFALLAAQKRTSYGRYIPAAVSAAEIAAVALVYHAVSGGEGINFAAPGFMGMGLSFTGDGLRILFGLIAAVSWFFSSLFSAEYFDDGEAATRYHAFCFLTLSGVMGVFLSADLMTAVIFFEIMSFASFPLVAHEGSPGAVRAGKSYLTMAVVAGLAALSGVMILWELLGTTEISLLPSLAAEFSGDVGMLNLAGGLILFGFGSRAGIFPLHIWMSSAIASSPTPASALLSGVMTKTGVLGMIAVSGVLFPRSPVWGGLLLTLGVFGMLSGGIMALFSTDIKKILTHLSVSQIGFVIAGLGMAGLPGGHAALAARGATLNMVNHSVLNLVLFICAGALEIKLHGMELRRAQGFGRGRPIFTFALLAGTLGLVGLPLTSGYAGQTALRACIAEIIVLSTGRGTLFFRGIEVAFVLAGGLAVACMLKIFIIVCIDKSRASADRVSGRVNFETVMSLILPAALIPIMGFMPGFMYDVVGGFGQAFMGAPDPAYVVDFFHWRGMSVSFLSAGVGILIYTLVVRRMPLEKGQDGESGLSELWENPRGLYGWAAGRYTRILQRLRIILSIPDIKYDRPAGSSEMRISMIRSMFSLLAFSFFLYFIGFIVVLFILIG